ncbi:MAG TPA: NAD(+) synthase [Desulfuromonadaceae bacterium]
MGHDIGLSRELGYLRIGAAVPELRVADVGFNVEAIIGMILTARDLGIQVLAFPEMAVTGYTLGDLVQHQALLTGAEKGLSEILAATAGFGMMVIVGMPLTIEQKVFNCAVAINGGNILGVVPKTFLPDYREFYEKRWFASGAAAHAPFVHLAGQQAPFGTDIIFKLRGIPSATLGVEVCEDLWVPFSPHGYQAVAGATVLFNLSASNEVLGKADWRRTMVAAESGRCQAAYCYVSCGLGESSNDVLFGGHAIIAEGGAICEESRRLVREPQLVVYDVDLERLTFDRRQFTSFQDPAGNFRGFRLIETEVDETVAAELRRFLAPHPFVPADPSQRGARCREVFYMQVGALARKLEGAGLRNIVLGVSGGLDSTLALLAAVRTMDFLELPRTNVHTYTLPGFGTTRRTRTNAAKLCRILGTDFREVGIVRTCNSSLKDLGHAGDEDIVFENVQARYRTEFLFNKANELEAINLGTGDLTEVALGWSTFAGDQISHYHVNVSVPKTLVRYLLHWVAEEELAASPARKVLTDILETPISPELRRPDRGKIAQKSEDVIGPVELADFYLYRFIRFGMRPGKILFLANEVNRLGRFSARYGLDDLYVWLKSFINRFFRNQFKRTCMPEGPKVGSVSLSPRGDWRMPSDAEPGVWLEDLEEMYRRLRA